VTAVIPFPKARRARPNADAECLLGDSIVLIEPHADGWAVIECGGNGAMMLGSGLPKSEAIGMGLSWVRRWNSELKISNSDAS